MHLVVVVVKLGSADGALYKKSSVPQDTTGSAEIPPRRPYRAKGPTLGKGKACEYCRYRRIRCSGTRPTCQNCRHQSRECIYLDKPRQSASTTALESKLADLEERYRILSELEGLPERGEQSPSAAETARNWVASLGESPSPQEEGPGTPVDPYDDPWLERRMTRAERISMFKLYKREGFRYGVSFVPRDFIQLLEGADLQSRPHPCLFNAIILVARDIAMMPPDVDPISDPDAPNNGESNFVIPESAPSDAELLSRTQAHCSQSLGDVDRLQDYLQAMLLLGYWFLRKGRLMEGQYSLAVACRLIINCKLHQIDPEVMREMAPTLPPPPEGESLWDRTLLGRPKDAEDLAHRIAIFWHSYYGDKTRSLLTGLPPTYDNDETCHVTTPFPVSLDKFISGEVFTMPHVSCDSLFDGSAHSTEVLGSLLLKALTLLDYAIRFATRTFSRPQSRIMPPATFELYQELPLSPRLTNTMDILGLKESLARFKESYERMFADPELMGSESTRGKAFEAASIRTLIRLKGFATEIHLSYSTVGNATLPLENEDEAFKTRLEAAHQCAIVTAEAVEEMNRLYGTPAIEGMCMLVGVLLGFACGVIHENIDKINAQLESGTLTPQAMATLERELQDELDRLQVMSGPIERIRTTYPVIDLHWQRIEDARHGASETISTSRS